MYVRVCRYRVQAELMEQFLAVQKRAADLYQRYGDTDVHYYQGEHDACEWMEVHRYSSQAACASIAARLGQQPEVVALWDQFQGTLDPYVPLLVDEYQERSWLSADQANNVFEEELAELLPEGDEPQDEEFVELESDDAQLASLDDRGVIEVGYHPESNGHSLRE